MTTDPMLAWRISALESVFRQMAGTRMAGQPEQNAALRVEAVGFEPCPAELDLPAAASGMLVTPWHSVLVRLPLAREDDPGRVGVTRRLAVGRECFDFVGAHEAAIGTFDACMVWSSMSDFAAQENAVATAQALLARWREPVPGLTTAGAVRLERPARRSFLFGRIRRP